MGCWIEGGAGFFLFSVLPGGAVELPGRSRPAPGVVDLRGVAIALAQALSTKSPIPTNVYASAIGLCTDFKIMQSMCTDSKIMQSRRPSNSEF